MGREEGPFAQATQYAIATRDARSLREVRHRRYGQPVYVTSDHPLNRKGQVATWEKFNVRLAVVKFSDNTLLGYEPGDLLLPTRFDDHGQPVFEVRICELCQLPFPLLEQELQAAGPPARCPACQAF